MNIINCNGCGVLLNRDILVFPQDIYTGGWGEVNEEAAAYNGEEWVAFTCCPVCQCQILEK